MRKKKKSLVGWVEWNDYQIFGVVDKTTFTNPNQLYTPSVYRGNPKPGSQQYIKVHITIEELK